jgi:hypothetical protein
VTDPSLTGTSSDTWTVTVPCAEADSIGGPCDLRELDHYDQPGTGFVWCGAHGAVVGTIHYAEAAA